MLVTKCENLALKIRASPAVIRDLSVVDGAEVQLLQKWQVMEI